jgi:hypothetical protein
MQQLLFMRMNFVFIHILLFARLFAFRLRDSNKRDFAANRFLL